MKNLMIKILAGLMLTTILFTAPTAFAKGQGGRQGGPPPEAIEACEGKETGDMVQFEGRRSETLKATCRMIDGQLAAVPNNRPKGGTHKQ